ncbi:MULTISPECIES: type II toxin-antitoxin system RelB family antitoxin [unclassified Gemella]|uniref:type II toxin-antitoxin system RelB family antitoxin n=1 Tax=unclassified Gemella TaxID=2624949 RepID=UPI00107459F7|nr:MULTISPECIES: DUF6290 family protein [unclassified Gemella]MBF0710569.1 antitoxin [Gemella sp. GL1.1]MBF0746452.1 antitoxin [Gemella sp. 19428wG2_WT2a]NYS27913.1 antitoxin [Gemella sp. GL1]TFU60234.1 antitoxin [Gemella sp. WT2a]
MATITLKVSEQDKLFMQYMAKFEGVTLSELIRNKTLEALEDQYDARVGELAYEEYLKDKENGLKAKTIDEVAEELGIEL